MPKSYLIISFQINLFVYFFVYYHFLFVRDPLFIHQKYLMFIQLVMLIRIIREWCLILILCQKERTTNSQLFQSTLLIRYIKKTIHFPPFIRKLFFMKLYFKQIFHNISFSYLVYMVHKLVMIKVKSMVLLSKIYAPLTGLW